MPDAPPPLRPPAPRLAGRRLLDAWDRGGCTPGVLRPAALLAAGWGLPFERVLDLPLGLRDAALLQLRLEAFGDPLQGFDRCPRCTQEVEFQFPTRDLVARTLGTAALPDAPAPFPTPPAPAPFERDGWRIEFRPVTTRDLAEAAAPGGVPGEIGARIVRRCLVRTFHEGQPAAPAEVPLAWLEDIARAQVEHDPVSEILFHLDCPSCGHAWESLLDCGAFLGREVAAAARRLLRQVHDLASAYGWSERAILALPADRRLAYLELIESARQPNAVSPPAPPRPRRRPVAPPRPLASEPEPAVLASDPAPPRAAAVG